MKTPNAATMGVALAIVAGACSSIGQVVQAKGARSAEAERLAKGRESEGVARSVARRWLWWLGLALDVLGALLVALAINMAPVSVVQPVASSGIAWLALIASWTLGEKLEKLEYLGVALCMLGVAAFGLTSAAMAQQDRDAQAHKMAPVAVVIVGVPVAIYVWTASPNQSRHRDGNNHVADEARHGAATSAGQHRQDAVQGLGAGIIYGLSACTLKTAFLLSRDFASPRARALVVAGGLCGSIFLSATGVLVRTRALAGGASVVIVCSCGAVSMIATVVFFGLSALGETIPRHNPMLTVLHVFAWVAFGLAVSLLSSRQHKIIRQSPDRV